VTPPDAVEHKCVRADAHRGRDEHARGFDRAYDQIAGTALLAGRRDHAMNESRIRADEAR
jgi:hypothetical protein